MKISFENIECLETVRDDLFNLLTVHFQQIVMHSDRHAGRSYQILHQTHDAIQRYILRSIPF